MTPDEAAQALRTMPTGDRAQQRLNHFLHQENVHLKSLLERTCKYVGATSLREFAAMLSGWEAERARRAGVCPR